MGYPKEVYEKAWAILDGRRDTAQQTLQQHQQEVRMKIPEIGDIQRKMVATAASITKSVVSTPGKAKELVEQLSRENLALQDRREELLVQHGYPKDYLQEKYTCSKCSDTGYVGTEMCDCFATILKQEAFSQLSEVSDSNRCRFEEFSLDYYPNAHSGDGVNARARMSEIYEFCRVYAKNFSKNAPSLLMMGRTGLGKTHLSLAIAWEVTTQGFGVVYTPVQKLMDKLETDKFSYDPAAKESYSSNINSVIQCDLLVLDDLGTEFSTSFTKSTIYNIVNTRMVEGRPTIINTNLEMVELESVYSQRMASRLGFGYKILRFYGDDIRYVKRKQRFNPNK